MDQFCTINGEAVPSRRLLTRSTSYIPYGEVFVEESSTGWQSPFYFNSKELDEETGLYYYGARYLDPTEARWMSVDPMFEKYAGMNPYNYCAGNPVMLVDPDGSSVFYNENGDYVGTDDKGYEGHIYITSQIDFDNYNKKYLCPMETQTLTPEAYSKIYTDVLKKMGINTSTLYNGKISVKGVCVKFDLIDGFTMNYSYNNPSMNVRYLSTSMDTNTEKGIKIQVNQLSDEVKNELCTVENVFNSLGIHEYNGHGINRYGDYAKNHHKVYESQILDPSFGKTTQKYKDHVLSNYYHYLKKENVGYSGDNYRKIYNLYEKNK